jgi:hypothetical protein
MSGQATGKLQPEAAFQLFRCRGGCFHLCCHSEVMIHLSPARLLAMLELVEAILRSGCQYDMAAHREGLESRRGDDGTLWVVSSGRVALHLSPGEARALRDALGAGRTVLEEVPEPEWRSSYVM